MHHKLRPLVLLLAAPLSLFATSNTAAAQWTGDGPIWTTDLVGIGTSTPSFRLHVASSVVTPTLKSDSSVNGGTAICGHSTGTGAHGVVGMSDATSGNATGVKGYVKSPTGKAMWGYAAATSGTSYAVYGQQQSPAGYSGYFTGGKFYAGSPNGFIGLGRNWKVSSSEVVGISKNTTGWGGMYMNTNGGGMPYYGYSTGGTARAFHYYDSGNGQWKLYCGGTRITVTESSGNVGIGTTSPNYKLHVNGSAGKPGGGSWSNASDRRLKTDVKPLDDALDRLLSLQGVSYRYIDPKSIGELSGTQLGVIAQDVEMVFPGWVDEGADGFKRVTFRGFEGVTIEALRELRDENRRLRDLVGDLSVRLDSLEAESR